MSKLFSLVVVSFFLIQSAQAAKVLQVKGNRALIDLEGDSVYSGDKFFVVDGAGKRRALLTIIQIKDRRAVAEVSKGSPQPGQKLQFANPSLPTAKTTPSKKKSNSEILTKPVNSWGLMGGLIMGTMSASFTGSSSATKKSASLTGTNYGLEGYYDHVFSNRTSLRLTGAYQIFNLSGSTTDQDCDGSNTCNVNISYLSGYGLFKYHLSNDQWRAWVGAGGGVLLPVAKSSNVINVKNTTMNFVVSMAAGGEYQLNKENYIPFAFEYHLFPPSSSVSSGMMVFKAGYGWNF